MVDQASCTREKLVLILWVVATVLGLVAAPALNAKLTTPLSVPHSDSYVTNDLLLIHISENIAGTFTVVVNEPSAAAELLRRDVAKIEAAA